MVEKVPLASVWEFIDGLGDTWRMEDDQGPGSPVTEERVVSSDTHVYPLSP